MSEERVERVYVVSWNRDLTSRAIAPVKSCILGRLGNWCAKFGGEPWRPRNANSRRYCQPDGDYQLPCQLHPVQGRRAHARTNPATIDPPPSSSSTESRARPDRNELFNYHDLSPGVSFQSIMHDRSWPDLPPSTLCFRISENVRSCGRKRARAIETDENRRENYSLWFSWINYLFYCFQNFCVNCV